MPKTSEGLKEILKKYCVARGWEPTDANLEEILLYGDNVFEQHEGEHRWWIDVFRVVDIDGTLIGCTSAKTTGDSGLRDIGWIFDWNSLCEVERKEVKQIVYEKLVGKGD